MYKQAVRVSKHITFSTVKAAFGFGNDSNIGKIFYTSMQAVPAFLKSVEEGKNVPCLIPLAIDQDVHFRVARDVIGKLGYYKPASSAPSSCPRWTGRRRCRHRATMGSAIYLNDNEETVRKKIGQGVHGAAGHGRAPEKARRRPGQVRHLPILQVLLRAERREAQTRYSTTSGSGRILAGEHKAHLAETINDFLKKHRARRERAKEKLEKFMVRD